MKVELHHEIYLFVYFFDNQAACCPSKKFEFLGRGKNRVQLYLWIE